MSDTPSTVIPFGTPDGVEAINTLRTHASRIVQNLITLGDKVSSETIIQAEAELQVHADAAFARMNADPDIRVPILLVEAGQRGLHVVTNQESWYLALRREDTPPYLRVVAEGHFPGLFGTLLANVVLGANDLDHIAEASQAFNSAIKRGYAKLQREIGDAEARANQASQTN